MAANTDRTRKLLVRTALATSTTIATLIGAQNFAMLDARDFQLTQTPVADDSTFDTAITQITTPAPITQIAPEITILHAAPSVTILRQAGQVNAAPSRAVAANTIPAVTTNIQPPAPEQISAPQPVVVQQPIAPRTRTSR